MALDPGDKECTRGLAKELHEFWTTPIEDGGMGAKDEEEVPIIDPDTGEQTGTEVKNTTVKRLCHSLAKIIVDYIVNNMEITGVEVSIDDVKTDVNITTSCPAGAGTGIGKGTGNATGKQSNNGTGLIR